MLHSGLSPSQKFWGFGFKDVDKEGKVPTGENTAGFVRIEREDVYKMEEQDADEKKPFLELSEEIPDDWQVENSGSQDVNTDSILEPGNPLLFQARERNQRRRSGLGFGLFAAVPRWALISMVISLVVILALMPQFLLILFGIIRQIALILRVLALPLGALFLALWLLRMFYPQNR